MLQGGVAQLTATMGNVEVRQKVQVGLICLFEYFTHMNVYMYIMGGGKRE